MATPETLYVFVEIPKGSRNKYEYDPEVGHVVLDRTLWTSVVYPADYGFIVDTIGRDGDPVDALVLVAEPTFPGCVIPVEPIGVFEMTDEKGEDDKVLCVPFKDPKWSHMHDIADIRDSLLDEIGHFFDVYKDLEHGADTWSAAGTTAPTRTRSSPRGGGCSRSARTPTRPSRAVRRRDASAARARRSRGSPSAGRPAAR